MSAHTFHSHTSRRFLWAPDERCSIAEPPETPQDCAARLMLYTYLMTFNVKRDKPLQNPVPTAEGEASYMALPCRAPILGFPVRRLP